MTAIPLPTALAVTRFGLGARPGELAEAGRDPRGWLRAQITSSGATRITDRDLPDGPAVRALVGDYLQARVQERQANREGRADAATPPAQPTQPASTQMRDNQRMIGVLADEADARNRQGLTTQAPFAERWVLFWANHFTVAARQLLIAPWVGVFEREAVRAHAFGRFADLLRATSLHPGMLAYLDQAQSMGPNSVIAQARGRRPRQQQRPRGLNENLAREILELHTLGAQGGYSQADVTEFARALTGWTIQNPGRALPATLETASGARFVEAMHEPGPRTLLGRTFTDAPQAQAPAILDHLAAHPSTARHIARKLAVHFVADDPPPALVARLEASFRSSGGDLAVLARTLIDSPEAWEPQQRKFKTPNEFLLSSLRAAGIEQVPRGELRASYEQLGQVPFRAPSPRGWPDTAAEWAGPDAILKRADWAGVVAGLIADTADPRAVLEASLGPLASDRTREAVRRAESAHQGLILLFMSPEFQRR